MKIKNKKSIKVSQQKAEEQENKIEDLKRDVIIWQQRYNKLSIIGKIISNAILFSVEIALKIIPLIILDKLNDNVILQLINTIGIRMDWKCVTLICVCVCFIFW